MACSMSSAPPASMVLEITWKAARINVSVDGMHRAGRRCPPPRNAGFGRRAHDRSVLQQLLVTEQRSGRAALPAPVAPLRRDHGVAEHRLEDVDLQRAFGKFG